MSAARRESTPAGPEAAAYGEALKEIFSLLGKSQNEVAKLLSVHPSQLSRFFSGKDGTVASRTHADALVRLVRDSGYEVPASKVAKLHELRRKAQQASSRQEDRVAVLQEQMQSLQAQAGVLQGRVQDVETVNAQLLQRLDGLWDRVREEESRARHELRLREQEHARRVQAEQRAERAEWGAEEAAGLLHKAQKQHDQVQERAARAQWEAEEASAELQKAGKQLAAAGRYIKESDAVIDHQREQLDQLRREVESLRQQVRRLCEEKTTNGASEPVADAATQVNRVQATELTIPAQALSRLAARSIGQPQRKQETARPVVETDGQRPPSQSPRTSARRPTGGYRRKPPVPQGRGRAAAQRAARRTQAANGQAAAEPATQQSARTSPGVRKPHAPTSKKANTTRSSESAGKLSVASFAKGIGLALAVQIVSYWCLYTHITVFSGRISASTALFCGIVAVILVSIAALIAASATSGKVAGKAASVIIISAALLAVSGNETLTLSKISDLAHKQAEHSMKKGGEFD